MAIKRIVGGVLGAGVAMFAGAGGFDDNTVRNDDGEIVESGGVGAFVLNVGDCVQMPSEDQFEVMSVEGVPCHEPHDAEVYYEFHLTNAEFPGEEEMARLADDGCYPEFEALAGATSEDTSNWGYTSFTPTAESWAEMDDREVTCFVGNYDGSPMDHSVTKTA